MTRRPSLQTFRLRRRGLKSVLGPLEAEVLEEVWRRGETTIREVWATIHDRRGLAFNTIMTVMNRLAEKGILIRRGRPGQYRFSGKQSRQEFMTRTSRLIAEGLVRDFGDYAIAGFVAAVRQVDPRRLELLRKAVTRSDTSESRRRSH